MATFGYVTATFKRQVMDAEVGQHEVPREGKVSFYATGTTLNEMLAVGGSTGVTVELVDGTFLQALPVGSYYVTYLIEGLPYIVHRAVLKPEHYEATPLDLNKMLLPAPPVDDGKPNYIRLFEEGE